MNYETFNKLINEGEFLKALDVIKSIPRYTEDFAYCLISYSDIFFKSDCEELTLFFVHNTETDKLIDQEIHHWVVLCCQIARREFIDLINTKHRHLLEKSHFWTSLATQGNYLTYSVLMNCSVHEDIKPHALLTLYYNQRITDNSSQIQEIELTGIKLDNNAPTFESFTRLNRNSEAMTSESTVSSRFRLANLAIKHRANSPILFSALGYQHHLIEFSLFYLAYCSSLAWTGELNRESIVLDLLSPEIGDAFFLNEEYQVELNNSELKSNRKSVIKYLASIIRQSTIINSTLSEEIGYNNISITNIDRQMKIDLLTELLPAKPEEVVFLK